MKFQLFKLTSCFIGFLLSASLFAQSNGPVLATVNGSKIYGSQVNEWVKSVVAGGGKDTPELRQTMLNDLIVREAILQDVKRTGLLTRDNNSIKVKIAEQNAILEIWFAQYFKEHPITEADIRTQYDQQAAIAKDPKNAKEYQLSQIIVGSEAEGDLLIKQINAGVSYEQLAKEKSLDKTSGAQGGLIGWVLPGRLTPPLDGIIPSLSKGKLASKPLQVGNLWYVIKVDDVRNHTFPSFEQAKPQISQALAQRQKQEAIQALLKSEKITIGDKATKK